MDLQHSTTEQLQQWQSELANEYALFKQQALSLDLTRGKPSDEQLTLSDALDGALNGNYIAADGTDTRNYGGLDGLKEARQLGADILGLDITEVSAQGNSSLTLMFLTMWIAKEFGLRGTGSAWKNTLNEDNKITFICPVPGYDRHFTVCEDLGINMVTIPMTTNGPDMDAVETLIKEDSSIRGMWCVPKYSNPTGVIYSDATIERIAKLGNIAHETFCVFWDNAYAVHDLNGFKPMANIMAYCKQYGTENNVVQFASTSKITHAGAGVAFIGTSVDNLKGFKKLLGTMSIGPDKVNQLRHMRLIPNQNALLSHMEKHSAILKPRFSCVLSYLNEHFGDNDLGSWEAVEGGYFVSFDSKPGLAKNIVKLAADIGVKLTPAGATFPYGNDPEDRNIRIAPSVPTLEQVDSAMKVFVLCVKLASVNQALDVA
ncbi:MAG: aminotransferase class I/II-fold pyridoxal phosphate-dependent enzyme [Cellvibrionaceae bacterium]